MALKIVFLFALVALAYGLPATEPSKPGVKDQTLVSVVPVEVEKYLADLLPGVAGAASLTLEAPIIEDESDRVREKRACRSIQVKTKSGRVITVKRC